MPLTFLSIIASRPSGTMFQLPLLGADPVLAPLAGRPLRGQGRRGALGGGAPLGRGPDLGRHLDLAAQRLEVGFLVAADLLPAERAEQQPASPGGQKLAAVEEGVELNGAPGYFLTLTVCFITVAWIVQMNS